MALRRPKYYKDRQGKFWKLSKIKPSFMPGFVEARRDDGVKITINRTSVQEGRMK